MDIESLEDRAQFFEGTHKAFAEELLVPGVNKCDMIRINMFDNHIPQAVVLAEGDFPRFFTNFENQVGEYSSSYLLADRDWTVVKKIKKNKLVTTFILKDDEGNIELVTTKPAERITERYGYKHVNPLNKKKEKDIVTKGEVMHRSTTYDKNMNFCYGRNLKAVYLSFDNMTYEDAIVISKSAKEKLKSYSVDEITITLNNNDLLINKYGNEETDDYKCLPEIGEVVKGTILTARKRINYESLLYDGTAINLSSINYDTDTVFYIGADSIVYDIDIFCNSDVELLKSNQYYHQILDIINNNNEYYAKVVKCLDRYMNNKKYVCSDYVKYIYDRYSKMINPNTVFRYDGNEFDNLVIKIKTYNENPLVIGSKITGRYGRISIYRFVNYSNE